MCSISGGFWLAVIVFFLFITWRKSESDSKYIVPLCHYSCAEVDFPFLITLQRLYTYRYSYPWCKRPFTLESVTIYLTFEDREMQNRKPEVELERSDYRTLRARSANICRSSPLIITALSAVFLFECVFSYLLYSSGAHGSGPLWLYILYLPGRAALAALHHSTGLSPGLCLLVSTFKEIFSTWPAVG